MTRAERRSRTELVRARRIDLYNQIDEWTTFRTEASEANHEYHFATSRSCTLGPEYFEEQLSREHARRIARNGEMRNEYVVGYRDNGYWLDGKLMRAKCEDGAYRAALDELGLGHLFRTSYRPG